MKKKIVLLVISLLILVLLVSGCKVIINGGGWIAAPGGIVPQVAGETVDGKATFGFSVQIDYFLDENEEQDYKVKGHLTYIDHVTGEKIIGKVTGIIEGSPGGVTGTYGDDGMFTFIPFEGMDAEPDYFKIIVTGGEYDGYMNEGIVEGGNVQSVLINKQH